MEGWPRGPRQEFAKLCSRKGARGFESHPFRMSPTNEEERHNCLCRVVDSNAGAMFGEYYGESNCEAVARPPSRKTRRVAAESYPFRQFTRLVACLCGYLL